MNSQGRDAHAILLAGVILAVAGCDATLQGLGASTVTSPTTTHVGPLFEGRLHLPRSFNYVAGIEAGHLLQASPSTVADQWRLGILAGYNQLARPEGSRVSGEATVRLGLFRGSNGSGPLVPAGGYGGVAVALPIRVSRDQDPWELDDLLYPTIAIVPQLGLNGLMPGPRSSDASLEVTASIGARVTLSSTLLP